MSGALIQLVSKGVQDVYLTHETGQSFFRMKFTRHTNFSQCSKLIKTISGNDSSVVIPVLGDVINALWIQGSDNLRNMFTNSTIELYLGGQMIDSQHFDYYTDIWTTYLSDTYSKTNDITSSFIPLHFFFCNHKAFLPLVALQNHQVEIKIKFDNEPREKMEVYGNYVFLDKEERESVVKRPMDFVITQVQRLEYPLNTEDGYNEIDIIRFKHPVRSLFFGLDEHLTFKGVDLFINGSPLVENMKPIYFHTIQNYYKSDYGVSKFDTTNDIPIHTRYYAYHFCLNASQYNPSGSCNFSRLNTAKLTIRGATVASERKGEPIYVYAVNYNVLRIKDGLGGLLFGN